MCGRGLDTSGTGWDPVTGCCEQRNGDLYSKNDNHFLDKLKEKQLLNYNSTPWSYF